MARRRRRSFVERRRAQARLAARFELTRGPVLTGAALEAALVRWVKDGERTVTFGGQGCFVPDVHGVTPEEEREGLKELVAAGLLEVREWEGGLQIDMSPLKRMVDKTAPTGPELSDRRLAAIRVADEVCARRAHAGMFPSEGGADVDAVQQEG